MRECAVNDLRTMDFRTVWNMQKEAVHSPDRLHGDLLYLVEHPPVITIGRSGNRKNVLASEEELRTKNIEVIEVDRGGDVTYHGPGQLVAYPILNLNLHKRDIGWYLRSLEEVILRTLYDMSIQAARVKAYTGIWVGDKKIAAIGVGVRRWITFHGLALNINPCLNDFALITPCGIRDKGVTSITELLGDRVERDAVVSRFLRRFAEVFAVAIVNVDGTPFTK